MAKDAGAPPAPTKGSKDASKDAKNTDKKSKNPKDASKSNKSNKREKEEELSEEDQKLKEELDMLVERIAEPNTELHVPALQALTTAIRTSTSSMTAVPKPLKLLKPHYTTLVGAWEKWPESVAARSQLADVLSVLAMTAASEASDALKYRILANTSDFGAWGHEYMRHLALEIGIEFRKRQESSEETSDLLNLALQIAPYFLKHNAEADAVDMLIEVEAVDRLPEFVDNQTYSRVCRYLVACSAYLDEESDCLVTAYKLYFERGELTSALSVLLAAHKELDGDRVEQIISWAEGPTLKQLGLQLGRQRRYIGADTFPEEVAEGASNARLSEFYRYLVKELNLEAPRMPDDIFRNGSEVPTAPIGLGPDGQSKLNLASIFVRGFINAGYCNDPLLADSEAAATYIHRTARGAVNSAAATTSLGLLHLWNYEGALQELDQHFHSSDEAVRAGALLGVGVATTGVHDEADAALGLLAEFVADEDEHSKSLTTSAVLGLAFAYAGTARADLYELLEPLVDASKPMEVACVAALAIGVIFVGSDDGEAVQNILAMLLERSHEDLSNEWAWFGALGFALLYMNRSDEVDTAVQAVHALEHPLARVLEVLLVICAYAGTGDVLQLQWLLKQNTILPYEDEDDEEDDEDVEADSVGSDIADAIATADSHMDHAEDSTTAATGSENPNASPTAADDHMETDEQAAPAAGEEEEPQDKVEAAKLKSLCTLGLGAIALGEEVGQEMVLRHFEHLMHFGDSYIKQAVPLATALVSASNPQMRVYETLSRYTHDPDFDVAVNAIFAMGVVSAGTLNARVAQLLRQLDAYYSRAAEPLFMVRFAQGLVQLGKGTLTLNPFTTERLVLSQVSLAGLLIVMVSLLVQPRSFTLSQHPSLLYFLVLAMQPRMLVTVDENLEPLKVTVRVGQAVDVVGQAGRPKTITGWVTQTTPVLLGVGERAELEDDDYVPLSSTLEGVVILRKKKDDEE